MDDNRLLPYRKPPKLNRRSLDHLHSDCQSVVESFEKLLPSGTREVSVLRKDLESLDHYFFSRDRIGKASLMRIISFTGDLGLCARRLDGKAEEMTKLKRDSASLTGVLLEMWGELQLRFSKKEWAGVAA